MKAPLELIVPMFADQVTAEFGLPVPCTVALHCEVAVGATDEGVQETATEETCDEGGGDDGGDGGDDGGEGEDGVDEDGGGV